MPISANKPREDLRPDLAPAFLAMDSAAGLPKANPIQSTQTSGKQALTCAPCQLEVACVSST